MLHTSQIRAAGRVGLRIEKTLPDPPALDIHVPEEHLTVVHLLGMLLMGLTLLWNAGCGPSGPPPYGFGERTTQRFVLETKEVTEVDGIAVTVTRYAEFDLQVEPDDSRGTELGLMLRRYYLGVEGAPGGDSELALSEEGMVTRSGGNEVRIGPDDPMPGGRTIAAVLRHPIARLFLDASGRTLADPWRSLEPVLQDLPLVEWIALVLPVLGHPGGSWNGSRSLPPLGQYRLGIDLPVRYEATEEGGRLRVRSAAGAQRTSIELTRGYRGALQLDGQGEAILGDGFVESAHFDLRTLFRAEDDSEVRSSYLVRLRCGECEPPINPPGWDSDTPEG